MDVVWLGVSALAIGSYAWFVQGTIVPLGTLDHIEYVLVFPSALRLAADFLIALGVVVAIDALVSRLRREETRHDRRYWRASLLLFLVWASLPAAMHPDRWWSAPILYLSADLAPVLAVASAALIALAAAAAIDVQRSSFTVHAWSALPLATLAIAFVTATMPDLRFSAVLHGDEPKYLRYCENLYQGRGFEVGDIESISSLPANLPPRLMADLSSGAAEGAREIRELGASVKAGLRGDGSGFSNRARYAGAWFVTGKRGGLYQVHTPGLSFLLFPGYAFDRFVLTWTASPDSDQVPARLIATDTVIVLMYAAWAITLFRLLTRYTGEERIAWIVAAVCFTTLPLAAFPFQIYPEVAAGLIVSIAAGSIVFDDKRSTAKASGIGLLAGYLFWLHVRFAVLSLVIVAAALIAWRRTRRDQIALAAGYVLSVGLFCLYVFHITGSVLPDALYFTQGNVDPLAPTNIPRGLVAYVFDGTWGLLASAPIFVLAFVGVGVMARHRPYVTLLAAALALSLASPSAAHSYRGAGATPLRHVVAVVPLAALPLAEALVRYRRSRAFRWIFAALALVSIYTAARYNLFHVKEAGPFVDRGVSGWEPNMLFPTLDAGGVTWASLLGWIAAAVVLAAWPFLPRARRMATCALAAALVIAIAGAQPTARSERYLPNGVAARRMLVDAASGHDVICRSSAAGRLSPRVIAGNPGTVVISADRSRLRQGMPARFTLSALNEEYAATWGMLAVDFGDGTPVIDSELIDTRNLFHQYTAPGFYPVTARLVLPGGGTAEGQLLIGVRAPTAFTSDRPTSAMPAPAGEMTRAPATARIRTVRVGLDRITAVVSDAQWDRSPKDLWTFRWSGTGWAEPTRVSLASGDGAIDPLGLQSGDRVAVVLTRKAEGRLERSDIVIATWPDRLLRLGAPVAIVE